MGHLEPANLIIKMIKDCWFNTNYTLSPGQRFVLQDWVLILCPWHQFPPFCGRGFEQSRLSICDPPPQIRLHDDHGLQGDQPP